MSEANSNSKKMINISPDLVEKYQSGELSNEQRHELEHFLLENSFEQEAFEGFEATDLKEARQGLARLNERLPSSDPVTVTYKPYYGIAAAVGIVALVSTFLIFFQPQDENKIVQKLNEIEQSSAPLADSIDESYYLRGEKFDMQEQDEYDQVLNEVLSDEHESTASASEQVLDQELVEEQDQNKLIAQQTQSEDLSRGLQFQNQENESNQETEDQVIENKSENPEQEQLTENNNNKEEINVETPALVISEDIAQAAGQSDESSSSNQVSDVGDSDIQEVEINGNDIGSDQVNLNIKRSYDTEQLEKYKENKAKQKDKDQASAKNADLIPKNMDASQQENADENKVLKKIYTQGVILDPETYQIKETANGAQLKYTSINKKDVIDLPYTIIFNHELFVYRSSLFFGIINKDELSLNVEDQADSNLHVPRPVGGYAKFYQLIRSKTTEKPENVKTAYLSIILNKKGKAQMAWLNNNFTSAGRSFWQWLVIGGPDWIVPGKYQEHGDIQIILEIPDEFFNSYTKD